jgi:hypothetical protein
MLLHRKKMFQTAAKPYKQRIALYKAQQSAGCRVLAAVG